jgi:hypothetical protein
VSEPPPLAYEVPLSMPPAKPLRAFVVPGLCVAAAWLVGAATNAINGLVSPTYFAVILGRRLAPLGLPRIVIQGLLESTAFGLLLAIVVAIVYLASTRCRLPIRGVIGPLSTGVAICLTCWLLGGLSGAVWAGNSPETFRELFILVASTPAERFRWGFVGGSINGAYLGGIASIVTVAVGIHLRWRRLMARVVRSESL